MIVQSHVKIDLNPDFVTLQQSSFQFAVNWDGDVKTSHEMLAANKERILRWYKWTWREKTQEQW